MASKRYLLVQGVAGVAVPDTRSAAVHGQSKRFIGHDLSGCRAGNDGKCTEHADPDHVLDHYRVSEHVMVDTARIRAAIQDGALKLLGEVIAKTHDAAVDALKQKIADAAVAEVT